MSDGYIKHLEFIQSVITRMGNNSFAIKTWTVTIAAAIIAFTGKDGNPGAAWIALIPSVMFWGLDGYFLRQERLFRKLYDQVRGNPPASDADVDFSMDTSSFVVDGWLKVCFSKTLFWFYGTLVIVIIIVWNCPRSRSGQTAERSSGEPAIPHAGQVASRPHTPAKTGLAVHPAPNRR